MFVRFTHCFTPFHKQAIESRIALAGALARQWFGVLMVPKGPEDVWIAEGLAGHLEDLFVRKFLGQNELAYR